MSRKPTVSIEDSFDDDTDLPLPSHPLPNTGTRGPLLQEIASDDDRDDNDNGEEDENDVDYDQHRAGPASPASQSQFRFGSGEPPLPKNTVTDITPYKSYVSFYPFCYFYSFSFTQLDMHLPDLHRRKKAFFSGPTASLALEICLVAFIKRYS